jgi:16S rRNA (guanine527-N7)-methyltransferase
MNDRSDFAILTDTLRLAQRVGFFGQRPIPLVIEHARHFVEALEGVTGTVADIGSGGGVPGLVIAVERPDLEVVLIDRRQKRTDFLSRAVARLGYEHRVTVRCDDVERIVAAGSTRFDAVTARGFGPPDSTLRLSERLVVPGGPIVISEPPPGDCWAPDDPWATGDRWDATMLAELGLHQERRPGVVVFRRR